MRHPEGGEVGSAMWTQQDGKTVYSLIREARRYGAGYVYMQTCLPRYMTSHPESSYRKMLRAMYERNKEIYENLSECLGEEE